MEWCMPQFDDDGNVADDSSGDEIDITKHTRTARIQGIFVNQLCFDLVI